MHLIIAITSAVLLTFGGKVDADVSHEDIRDAILSLVTIFRDNSDKLERHEYRERQLGEQLKKALAGLDKRYRSQEQAIVQMSERIKNLEASSAKKDDSGTAEISKISDAVMNLQRILEKVTGELEESSKESAASYTVKGGPMDSQISIKLDKLTAALESGDYSKKILVEFEKIHKNIEKGNGGGGGNSHKINEILERHRAVLDKIEGLVKQTAHDVEKLPTKWDMSEMVNSTIENLQEVREDLLERSNRGVAVMVAKLDEKGEKLSEEMEGLMKTTTEVQSMTEALNAGASKSYEQLLTEVRGLSTVEQVMIQTADNVMDTKRRIEYGVQQILLEVGDLVKRQGKVLNGTVSQRFDDIEATILDNQTGAISNLTTKIEMEISQVWRQIGIMYQQLTASATALDRLQQQTDAYVNGSVKTMDSMENKVGMITSRMTEVDENLNFLLGRLSMVTSEYNQIKSGLAGALDDIRSSFTEVQGKLKDMGPGPRPIPEDKILGNDVPSE